MIGIIGKTSLFEIQLFKDSSEKIIETEFGTSQMLFTKDIAFIPRHGLKNNILPHNINHKANIMALKKIGVKYIASFCSVGSLNKDTKPSTILIPHDYINFWNIPTFFEKKIVHIVPSLNDNLRNIIISTSKKIGIEIIEKGIYIQTTGPRLETKAEIALLKNYGDVVGMTMASEATLAKEIGLNYANISIVVNYCNGITEETLSMEEILKNAKQNNEKVKKLLLAVIDNMIKTVDK